MSIINLRVICKDVSFSVKSDAPQTPLFGFQLWLAENKDELATQIGGNDEEALREAGLAVSRIFFAAMPWHKERC